MKGSVTISLTDFQIWENQHTVLQEKLNRHTKASEELAVFLSFLKRNIPDIDRHIDQFNKQSSYSHITESDGRLTIVINRETQTNKIQKQQEYNKVSEDS